MKKTIIERIKNAKTVKDEMEEMMGKDYSDGYQKALEDILEIIIADKIMKKSNLVLHAERELKLAGMFDKDADYNGTLAPHILKIVEVFSSERHSGASASITIEVLNKLLRFQTLTPITSNPEEWMKVEKKVWQNKRNPAIFSKNGGKDWYYLDKEDEKREKEEFSLSGVKESPDYAWLKKIADKKIEILTNKNSEDELELELDELVELVEEIEQEKLKDEYKKGYNQRLKDEGKTEEDYQGLYL